MSISEIVDEIAKEAKNYSPSNKARAVLQNTTLVSIIGPFTVGKTTAMREIGLKDKDFSRVHGFTTRPIRSDETIDTYRFLPHTEAGLQRILDLLRAGKLVQVAVHPSTGYVYGTDTKDFRNKYSILATLSNVMEDLRSLPFGGVREIGMVTSPVDWQGRVRNLPEVIGDKDIKKRMSEAIISLEWLIKQGNKQAWVVNDNGHLDEVVEEIIGISKGQRQATPKNREVGQSLLKFIEGSVSMQVDR